MQLERQRRACDVAYGAALLVGLLALAVAGVLERKLAMVANDDFSKIWAGFGPS